MWTLEIGKYKVAYILEFQIVIPCKCRASIEIAAKTAPEWRSKSATQFTNAVQRWPKMRTKIEHNPRPTHSPCRAEVAKKVAKANLMDG